MNFPGNCYFNHRERKMWIDIPKNASKTIGHHLRASNDWVNGNYIQEGIYDYRAYAVIRDPIKRWRGSTIEIAFHHLQYNDFDYSVLGDWFKEKDWKNFEKKHDLHHLNTSYFVQGIGDLTWIPLNKNFETLVQSYLGISEPLVNFNTTDDNLHKRYIEPYVDEILSDPSFVQKLKTYYEDDYAILENC